MSKAGSSYGCARRSAAMTSSCRSAGKTVSSRSSATRSSRPARPTLGERSFAAEERARPLRVPGAMLVVADPPGAGVEERLADGVEGLARHEHDRACGSREYVVDRLQGRVVELDARRAALSRSCSGRDAPTIALATFGSRRIHASASCAVVIPARRRSGARRCTRSSTSSARTATSTRRVRRRAFPPRASRPARYLPLSTPCASGE